MDFFQKENDTADYRGLDCALFSSKSRDGSPLFVPAHWHERFEIVLCNGEGTLFAEGKNYSYGYGDIILIPCSYLHGFTESIVGDYTVFSVKPENLISRQPAKADYLLEEIIFGKKSLPFVLKADCVISNAKTPT